MAAQEGDVVEIALAQGELQKRVQPSRAGRVIVDRHGRFGAEQPEPDREPGGVAEEDGVGIFHPAIRAGPVAPRRRDPGPPWVNLEIRVERRVFQIGRSLRVVSDQKSRDAAHRTHLRLLDQLRAGPEHGIDDADGLHAHPAREVETGEPQTHPIAFFAARLHHGPRQFVFHLLEVAGAAALPDAEIKHALAPDQLLNLGGPGGLSGHLQSARPRDGDAGAGALHLDIFVDRPYRNALRAGEQFEVGKPPPHQNALPVDLHRHDVDQIADDRIADRDHPSDAPGHQTQPRLALTDPYRSRRNGIELLLPGRADVDGPDVSFAANGEALLLLDQDADHRSTRYRNLLDALE